MKVSKVWTRPQYSALELSELVVYRNRLLAFLSPVGEVWEYDGEDWRRIADFNTLFNIGMNKANGEHVGTFWWAICARNRKLYAGGFRNDNSHGIVVCYDETSWVIAFETTGADDLWAGGTYPAPITAGSKLYCGGLAGDLYEFDGEDWTKVKSFAGEQIHSIHPRGDDLYVGTTVAGTAKLYKINPTTWATIWVRTLPGAVRVDSLLPYTFPKTGAQELFIGTQPYLFYRDPGDVIRKVFEIPEALMIRKMFYWNGSLILLACAPWSRGSPWFWGGGGGVWRYRAGEVTKLWDVVGLPTAFALYNGKLWIGGTNMAADSDYDTHIGYGRDGGAIAAIHEVDADEIPNVGSAPPVVVTVWRDQSIGAGETLTEGHVACRGYRVTTIVVRDTKAATLDIHVDPDGSTYPIAWESDIAIEAGVPYTKTFFEEFGHIKLSVKQGAEAGTLNATIAMR